MCVCVCVWDPNFDTCHQTSQFTVVSCSRRHSLLPRTRSHWLSQTPLIIRCSGDFLRGLPLRGLLRGLSLRFRLQSSLNLLHIFTSPHSVTLNLRLVFERSSHLFLLVWPPKPREKYFIAYFFFARNALVLSLSLVLLVHLQYKGISQHFVYNLYFVYNIYDERASHVRSMISLYAHVSFLTEVIFRLLGDGFSSASVMRTISVFEFECSSRLLLVMWWWPRSLRPSP